MSLTVVGMRCGLTPGRMAVTDRSRRGRGARGPARTAGGNAEWCVRHRQRHGVASKNGKRDAELPGDFLSGYTSEESENTNSKSRVTPLVTGHCSVARKSQDMEASQAAADGGRAAGEVVRGRRGILLSREK